MADQQNYKNHARLVPLFHFVVLPVLLINFIVSAVDLFRAPGLRTGWGLVVAFTLVALAFVARGMALTVQDRVIRMEMRQRCKELLPADLHARVHALTPKQLVALRFASDGELVALVAEVLDGKLTSQNEIKMRVHDWQGDYLRA